MILFDALLLALVLVTLGSWYTWHRERHRCQGVETGRRYLPGIVERGGKVWGWMAENEEILYGYTEITYKCSECGKHFNKRVVGKIND
jgi:hypothetical protein